MKAVLLALALIMTGGHALALDFTTIQIKFDSDPEIKDWGFMCKGFRCSMNPMTEEVVDMLDSLDKAKSYTCEAKVRQSRLYNVWSVHAVYALKGCR